MIIVFGNKETPVKADVLTNSALLQPGYHSLVCSFVCFFITVIIISVEIMHNNLSIKLVRLFFSLSYDHMQ